MSKYADDFRLNDKGYGPLRFIKKGYDAKDKGAALFGRAMAIHDFEMGIRTEDFEKMESIKTRIALFVDFAVWVEDASKRARNAWNSMCCDYPGMGKIEVADPNVSVSEIEKWYEWEYEGLECAKRLGRTFTILFGWNKALTAETLLFPLKEVTRISMWNVLPSDEVQMLFDYAYEDLDAIADWHILCDITTKDNYSDDAMQSLRDMFVEKWKEGEDKLLSVPSIKRREVDLYE